jgi:hypothetical protein
MKTLLLFFIAVLAFGQTQTPGTVAQSSTSNVVGTAGTLTCTLTNSSPALPSGVHVVCSISGAAVLTMDSVVPTGTNGMVGSFGSAGNIITWLVNQPQGQTAYAWQMAANGASKQGTF